MVVRFSWIGEHGERRWDRPVLWPLGHSAGWKLRSLECGCCREMPLPVAGVGCCPLSPPLTRWREGGALLAPAGTLPGHRQQKHGASLVIFPNLLCYSLHDMFLTFALSPFSLITLASIFEFDNYFQKYNVY